uniref:Uncharacterized protein n=1 Tax=Plectus sambesii TaxID=2011161 RepID=A0A914WGJ0_9BILA
MPVQYFDSYSAVPAENRPMDINSATKWVEIHEVEDDRSLGEKAMDVLHNVAETTKEVAHDIKEKLTPDLREVEIAHAKRKYNELNHQVLEDLGRFEAEEHRLELKDEEKNMEEQELANRKYAELNRKEQHQKAETEAYLQKTLNEQEDSLPYDVKIVRATEIF